MAAIQVNVRFPEILLSRIDHAAGEGERSKWIIDACRMRLDNQTPAMFGSDLPDNPPRSVGGSFALGTHDFVVSSTPDPKSVIESLRSTIKGIESKPFYGLSIPDMLANDDAIEIPICGKTWWEDGEQYQCLMDKGHKLPKCGQRGMARNITP